MKFKMRFTNDIYTLCFLNTINNYEMETMSLYSISKYININKTILDDLLKKHNGIICKNNCIQYCIFKKQQDIINCIDQLNILLKLSGEYLR